MEKICVTGGISSPDREANCVVKETDYTSLITQNKEGFLQALRAHVSSISLMFYRNSGGYCAAIPFPPIILCVYLNSRKTVQLSSASKMWLQRKLQTIWMNFGTDYTK